MLQSLFPIGAYENQNSACLYQNRVGEFDLKHCARIVRGSVQYRNRMSAFSERITFHGITQNPERSVVLSAFFRTACCAVGTFRRQVHNTFVTFGIKKSSQYSVGETTSVQN